MTEQSIILKFSVLALFLFSLIGIIVSFMDIIRGTHILGIICIIPCLYSANYFNNYWMGMSKR